MSNNNLLISKLNKEDINSFSLILDEYRVFYGKSSNIKESKKYIEENFNNNKVIFLIMKNATEQCVGFCTLFESLSTVQVKKILILNDLYIAQQYRRNSYATKLLNHATQLAERMGINFLKLETAENNIIAQALYTKLEWEHNTGFYTYTKTITKT